MGGYQVIWAPSNLLELVLLTGPELAAGLPHLNSCLPLCCIQRWTGDVERQERDLAQPGKTENGFKGGCQRKHFPKGVRFFSFGCIPSHSQWLVKSQNITNIKLATSSECLHVNWPLIILPPYRPLLQRGFQVIFPHHKKDLRHPYHID